MDVQSNGMHFSQDALIPLPIKALKKLFHRANIPPFEMNCEASPG